MTSSNGTFSVLLALCPWNSPVTGEFPSQRPVTRGFGVFFDLCLNKRLNKQSWRRWFETPWRTLIRTSLYWLATYPTLLTRVSKPIRYPTLSIQLCKELFSGDRNATFAEQWINRWREICLNDTAQLYMDMTFCAVNSKTSRRNRTLMEPTLPLWKITSHNNGILREHYRDVIISAMAFQITGVSIVYLTVCSGADQRKHQSFASLAFVTGEFPGQKPVTRKMIPFDDVTIMMMESPEIHWHIIDALCGKCNGFACNHWEMISNWPFCPC